jgi:nitrate/TMAO reductase-like tetraheme cytochrome c subunit
LENLGPLFVHPQEPGYFWIVVLAVSLPTIAAGLYVLVRGQLPAALSSSALILLPLVAYLLGDIHVMSESKTVEFCGSCHETMSPLLESLRTDPSTLAGQHYQRGAIPYQTACYTCHSGYGLTGDLSAKMAGMNHMLHTAMGNPEFPLALRRPFDIDACLDCHAEAAPFRAIEVHRDPAIQQALVDREMGCTGSCHLTAHPETALNGAVAWGEAHR